MFAPSDGERVNAASAVDDLTRGVPARLSTFCLFTRDSLKATAHGANSHPNPLFHEVW